MSNTNTVPDTWQMVRMGDAVQINLNAWMPADDPLILYLDLGAITAPGRLSDPKELAVSDAPSRARRRVHSGDILVSTVRPNLRGFAHVIDAPINLVASTGFAVLTPMPTVSGSFIYHQVMAQEFADHLEQATTGQAYPAVRPTDIADYLILLPPLAEQQSIAAILNSIDEAIEATETVIDATEQLRDALLHELLTRGIPGSHAEKKTVTGLGKIPSTWAVVTLREILSVNQPGAWGEVPRETDLGVPVLRAANMTEDGRIDPTGIVARRLSASDIKRRLMRDGDLLLERSGGGPGRPVGRVARIDGISPVYCSNFCQHLRVDTNRCDSRFATRALWHRYRRGITSRLEHRTTGIRNLDYPGYLAFPFPLPPVGEQRHIADILDSVDEFVSRTSNDLLVSLRSANESLRSQLLAGKLIATGESRQ